MGAMGGVGAYISNHDENFARLSSPPIMVNKYDLDIEDDRKELNGHLKTVYDSDMFTTVPSCRCGQEHDTYKRGKVCTNCNSVVAAVTEEEIESKLWMHVPKGTPAFINPQVWAVWFMAFNIKGFNPFEYFADRQYKPSKNGDYKNKEIYQFVASLGYERGLNTLIEHFDAIATAILTSPVVEKNISNTMTLKNSIAFYNKYRHVFFCEYLPIPSKLAFVLESNATGRYAALEMKTALDATLTICSAKKEPITRHDFRLNESIAIKTVRQLAKFYETHDSKNFAGKPGSLRKNIAGSRLPMTARCIITSHTGNHDMDEAILPRCLAIPLLKPAIINRLIARGVISPSKQLRLIQASIKQPIVIIDEILDELIQLGYMNAIVLFILRNPTLKWLSNRRFFCRTINRDPNDISIRISTLSIASSNADFDGDELNVMLQVDEEAIRYAEAFGSHNCVLDMNKVLTLSSDIGLPATLISNINRYLYSED